MWIRCHIKSAPTINIEKARQLLDAQASFDGYYNRNSMRMILADVRWEHGIPPEDALIDEFNLEEKIDTLLVII